MATRGACVQKGPWDASEESNFSPFKARPDQLAVIASMESSSYYKCLDDEAFMSNFDVEMTYRRQSGVPLLYWGNGCDFGFQRGLGTLA